MIHPSAVALRRRLLGPPFAGVFTASLFLLFLSSSEVHSHRLKGHGGHLVPPTAPEVVGFDDASVDNDPDAFVSTALGTSDENLPQNVSGASSSADGASEGSEPDGASSNSPVGVSGQEEDVHQSNANEAGAGEPLGSDGTTGSTSTVRRGLRESSEQKNPSIKNSNNGKSGSRSVPVGKHFGGSEASSLSGDTSARLANASESLAVLEPDSVPTAAELSKLLEHAATSEQHLIKQPVLDTTQYAAFTLKDMGLRGLAAVDNTQEAGAFAVSVGCGYFHDPPEIPGLAHMLEHMIFLGSATQTEATAWDELISSKGGMHNAHTKPDVTTFYVTAPTQHIPELLGVFLQHLLNPALLPVQVQSEAMAVHYEHEKNIPDLERVALHVALKYLRDSGTAGNAGESSSPVSAKFGTGSLETLCTKPAQSGIDLVESMRRFHRKCYVSSNMSISLRMGRINLQAKGFTYKLVDVIDLVSASFRKVVNGSSLFSADNGPADGNERGDLAKSEESENPPASFLQQADKKTEVDATDKSTNTNGSQKIEAKTSLPRSITLHLAREHGWRRKLFVFWSAPSSISNNLAELECQPSSVVQYLLEHPEEGFITKGEAFKHWTTRSSIFGLVLDLTDQGEMKHDQLMNIIREFTKKMQVMVNESFVSKYFENYKNISQLFWQSQDPLSPLDQVVLSAETSLQYPSRPDLTLSTGVCISTPSQDVLYREVRRLVEAMIPGNEVVVRVIPSGDISHEAALELAEYGVKYTVDSIEPAGAGGKVELKLPQPLSCKGGQAELVPHPPPSVCMSFSAGVPKISADDSTNLLHQREVASPPCVLLSDDNLTIVWHNGAPFKKPIVRSFIKARLEEGEATALNDAFGKIFTLILADHAKLKLSEYHGCGVDLIVAYTGGSLVFELQSFSSLVEEVTKGFGSAFRDTLANVTEEEFNLAAAGLKEDVSDFSASTAYELAMDVALSIVRQSRFSQFDLKEQLLSSEFTFANFKRFLDKSIQKTAIDCFFMGDIDATKAKELAIEFVDTIRTIAISYDKAAGTKTLNLTSDVEVLLKNPIAADVNNALVSLYISDPPDVLESILYSTIGEMVRAPFFDTVRTINMDGYVASASVTELPPVTALGTIVQSSLRSPNELEEHVCSFLNGMSKTIGGDLSSTEFKKRVGWVGQSVFSREQSSFSDFFSGMASQISSRAFCFIKAELSALAAQNFVQCPDALKKYLTKLVLDASRHRLVVKLEATSVSEGDSASGEERQCTLPGLRTRELSGVTPVGVKRTQPSKNITTPRGLRSERKDLIEQRRREAETDKKAAQASGNEGKLLMQITSDSSEGSPRNSAAPVNNASVDQATQGVGEPVVTGVDVTADAELSTGVEGEALGDEAEAAQSCRSEDASLGRRTITLENFADKPQEERQRLLASFQAGLERSSLSASSSEVWTGYSFDRYCTVHEATIRETSACQKPTDARISQILQENDDWEQLLDADSGTPKQENVGDAVAQDEQPLATEPLKTQLVEQQQQQTGLLQRLQEGISTEPQNTPAEPSSSIEPLHPQAVETGQQAQSQQQLHQAQVLLEAEKRQRVLVNALALLLQQQQQLMQPRVALLRRYGSVPSVVFTASGGAANNMTAGKQVFLEGGAPRTMIGMATTTWLQLKARQLQMLQARRQVVEQQIKDIQRRLLVTAAT
ncbi:hypothetical protein Esti_006632 [Eimeria stiedai]